MAAWKKEIIDCSTLLIDMEVFVVIGKVYSRLLEPTCYPRINCARKILARNYIVQLYSLKIVSNEASLDAVSTIDTLNTIEYCTVCIKRKHWCAARW